MRFQGCMPQASRGLSTASTRLWRGDLSRSFREVAAGTRNCCTSLHFLLVRRRFSTIIAWPRMAGIADFRLPIADGHWKELPHHFFNRQSAISPPRRGNENLAFGLRLRAALYHYRLSAFVACCFSSWCKMFPDLNQQGIRSLTSRKIPSTAGRFSIAPPRCWPGPPWGPRRLPMGASWVSK